MKTSDEGQQCELCERWMKAGTTRHHLIPVTCHKNKWFQKNFTRAQMQTTINLCRDCHSAVHRFIPKEKELGKHYHSLDRLRIHEQLAGFVRWVSKQR